MERIRSSFECVFWLFDYTYHNSLVKFKNKKGDEIDAYSDSDRIDFKLYDL